MKPVVQRPRADRDIDEIVTWLRRDSMIAARDFMDALEACYSLLGEQPRIGAMRHAKRVPELQYPLRFHPLKKFPRILIYYMDRPDAVEILRVWDAARGLESLMEGLETK